MGHSATLGRQIDAAERRSTIWCVNYDSNNVYWKQCDDLIEQQAMVTKKIASFTKDLKPVSIMKQGKHKSEIEVLDTSSSDDNGLSESEF